MIGVVVPFNEANDKTVVPKEGWLAVDPVVIPMVALGVLIVLTLGRRLLAAGLLIALGLASATLWLRYLGVPIIAPPQCGIVRGGRPSRIRGWSAPSWLSACVVWRREASVDRAAPG